MGLKIAAVKAIFEESLFQALNVINLENVSVRKNFFSFCCLGKSLVFQLLSFVFDSRRGSTETFILVVSPLYMRAQTNNLWPPAAIGKKLRIMKM